MAEDREVSLTEGVAHALLRVSALVKLLIEKDIFSEEEFDSALEEEYSALEGSLSEGSEEKVPEEEEEES